jgi:hypothetical protein
VVSPGHSLSRVEPLGGRNPIGKNGLTEMARNRLGMEATSSPPSTELGGLDSHLRRTKRGFLKSPGLWSDQAPVPTAVGSKTQGISRHVSTVPEPTERCRYEIHGFAVFLRTFSSEMSSSVSSFFRRRPHRADQDLPRHPNHWSRPSGCRLSRPAPVLRPINSDQPIGAIASTLIAA